MRSGYTCGFTLSYRDVEEVLAQRGLDVSYETVRRWVLKFGPLIARNLRQRRPRPSARWHLDEMVVRIAGRRMYLWRAVDHEGEVLDMLVQSRRDRNAAVRLMRKLLRKQGFAPRRWSPTSWARTALRSGSLAFPVPMSRDFGATIAPRIRIRLSGDESARCSTSNPPAQPSASSASMPHLQHLQPTTSSRVPIDPASLQSRSNRLLARSRRA